LDGLDGEDVIAGAAGAVASTEKLNVEVHADVAWPSLLRARQV
jgi:hypothetical protein